MPPPPESHAIGGGKTLSLLPCPMGAYNVIALVYVGDARDFRPAEFDAPTEWASKARHRASSTASGRTAC